MGPKNSTTTCAGGPQPKDLSWVDRMYMRFETMCVEVDKNPSLLLQETSKYVESQVNAVGANVKKLCTELIQDLIASPMLSPEGVEKKLECALHCKCHCMDFEKSKLIGTDAAGKGSSTKEGSVDHGDDTIINAVYQKQDIMKEEGDQVEMPNIVKKGLSKVETINIDATRERQEPENFEVCGSELKNTQGKDGTYNEKKVTTFVRQSETKDARGLENFQEELETAKKESDGNWESSDTEENKLTSEGSVCGFTEPAVCRSKAIFVEVASSPTANDNKDLAGANELNATYIIRCTSTSLESQDKSQPQMLEYLQEMRARSAESLCKRSVPPIHFQTVSDDRKLHLDAYSSYAKSTSSAEDVQAEEVKDSLKVGGSFQSLYMYDFKDDDPITMSEFFSTEDVLDEEQSAHWFAGEDIRKAIQSEIQSVEKSRYGEGFVNEFDLDWELL